MDPNPPRLLIVPSARKVADETLAAGSPQCGVFVKLNASARNCMWSFSFTGKSRKRPKSRLIRPGPRSELRPELPSRTSVTGRKAVGSNHTALGPVPPRIATFGSTWSANCVVPGTFRDVPDAVTVNGRPVIEEKMPFVCHPPSSFEVNPEVAHGLPFPNGNSQTDVTCRVWVRS